MQWYGMSKGAWGAALVAVAVMVSMIGEESRAESVYLVDTGNGGPSGGLSLTANQYVAGQFTLDSDSEIEALEGWMLYLNIINDLPVHAVLYGDAEGIPDWGDVVFTQLFHVLPSGFAPGWHGVDGLSLFVEAGIYWLAFEVDEAVMVSGAMPPTPLQELDLYAVDVGGTGWVANRTANLGIRVLPEPGLGTLLAFGVAGLAIGSDRRGRGAFGAIHR